MRPFDKFTGSVKLPIVGTGDQQREQAILDATAELLLRFGYNKLTMGDVADAVALHRGLVYLRFASKDELVRAVTFRELDRYAAAWRAQVETDPDSGSVGSVGRAMLRALEGLPLACAILARDEEVFGKYLRRGESPFERSPTRPAGIREFLDAMREAGVVRGDVDTRATAFILDALIPAIGRTFPRPGNTPPDADQPSWKAVLETLADMLDRTLTPAGGVDLAAGRSILLSGIDRARANLAVRFNHPNRPSDQKRTDEHD
jgi:AcrR family transcriptional regulator